MAHPTTPIIVGVGEIRDKDFAPADAAEPAELMRQAIRWAIADASLSADVLSSVDDLSVVPPWTWPYPDLPRLLADSLGLRPKHTRIGHHGGDEPALQCDEAARRIAQGASRLAVVTGGEALASLAACQKAGTKPPWTPVPAAKAISPGDVSILGATVGGRHASGLAIHVYPLYENGLRAHTQQTQAQNAAESAALYADFDRIACQHPYSWRSGEAPRDAAAIGTVTARNRMICSPYPLLQNAFNTVNLAAAVLLTSVEHARTLGIPEDKWVYVLGGAGTHDTENFWERADFHSSPSLAQSLDATLAVAGVRRADVDGYDFYSCFPVVPKLACRHLGLSVTRPAKPISVLGGLTSFGGAGNNYSLHAITEMTRQLRARTLRTGVVLANGGLLTHHHALCLSAQPRRGDVVYPRENPLLQAVQRPPAPVLDEHAEGAAIVETYTVEFDRQGRPARAHIVGRLVGSGHRFLANDGDAVALQGLADTQGEPIGRRGIVRGSPDGRNLFYLGGVEALAQTECIYYHYS